MNLTIARLDLRLRRRAMIGYAIGLAAYAFAIVALYPSFKNDAALDRLTESNSTMMAAFGVSGSLTSPFIALVWTLLYFRLRQVKAEPAAPTAPPAGT